VRLPTPRYEDQFQDVAQNLTRADWRRYFPDEPYRQTFDNRPIPPDAEFDDPDAAASGSGVVPEGPRR
jgi:hypothetical protein